MACRFDAPRTALIASAVASIPCSKSAALKAAGTSPRSATVVPAMSKTTSFGSFMAGTIGKLSMLSECVRYRGSSSLRFDKQDLGPFDPPLAEVHAEPAVAVFRLEAD